MRRLSIPTAAGLLLAGLALLAPPTAAAQEKDKPKFETVKFESVDAVELKGSYWPSTKGKKGPVAILLHKTGARSKEGGWKDLAEDLQKSGFAVLSFDFRGHGDSTTVGKSFWQHPLNNKYFRTPPAGKDTTLTSSSFPPGYLPHLVNDIAAAKRFLERRYNDSGDCNCSNIVLIGAEDGATLGALWLASETKRYRIIPVGVGQKNERPESKDVVACVWLNISETIGKQPVGQQLRVWLKDAGNVKVPVESKIPMAFIYGKKDAKAGATALALVKVIRPKYVADKKPDESDELRGTVEFGVANTTLVGNKLLTGDLDTRERIVTKYINAFILDDKKGLNEWEKRESVGETYMWFFPTMRTPASTKGEKSLAPVPLQQLGLR